MKTLQFKFDEDRSADTGLKSKIAFKILSEYFKRLEEAKERSFRTGYLWYPKITLSGVWHSSMSLTVVRAWRKTDGSIMLQSYEPITNAQKAKKLKQKLATELVNLCMSMTECNTLEQIMRMDRYPENMKSCMSTQMKDVKASQIFCMVELLCSRPVSKLVKKYGKEVVDSLTVCDLNPLQLEQIKVIYNEIMSMQQAAFSEIGAIEEESYAKKQAIMKSLDKSLEELGNKLNGIA